MARDPVPTHLNAYYMELQDAEAAALKANAEVDRLKKLIDGKRTEQGLKPEFADDDDEKGKRGRPKKESTPEEASGFGNRGNNGGQN
jgi:hypothetical protein